MSGSVEGVHENEFGVLAGWTADELEGRDGPSILAGACRGSGSPAALAWLAESMRLEHGDRLLDIGAGLGGPTAWAIARYGVQAVGIEPMVDACRGARRLFDHPVLAAAADALPVATATFDAAWLLGVLDTVPDATAALTEVRRALTSQGRVGILAYVATCAVAPDAGPVGNHFQTLPELEISLLASGLAVLDRVQAIDQFDAPLDWRLRQERLDDALADHHADDRRWIEAQHQERAFADLLRAGTVEPVLLHALAV